MANTITELQTGLADLYILGKTPLVYNAMSMKSKMQLLLPSGRKTAAERSTTLKHEPLTEYRDSVYRRKDDENGLTRLFAPSRWFKQAAAMATRRIPGPTMTEMQQLLWVENEYADLYGIPQVYMAIVRSADQKRTPDVRTRAIIPQWFCKITVNYVQPNISIQALGKLLSIAGIIQGVGDDRQEKGNNSFGQFELVNENDPRVQSLMKNCGMEAQDRALLEPLPYDHETEEMLSWYEEEVSRRRVRPTKKSEATA